tara:strand:+ start:138 stop:734 length:597 start_codon:yes stop_codon:yes gene_type:complete
MANKTNVVSISQYLQRKQKVNLIELISNNNKILKIMSEDIAKRVEQSILQYKQLEILFNLKYIFTSDVPIYSIIAIYALIKRTNYPDLSILSFSMYNSILNKLEFINVARNKKSINELVALLQNLISVQEKKILITKIQLIKIRDSSMNQANNIKELLNQCNNVEKIPLEFVELQYEVLTNYENNIKKYISQIELLKF